VRNTRMSTIHNHWQHVKSQAVLPDNVLEALSAKYDRADGAASVAALAQGEIDILRDCQTAIGWKTITSLAHKYYPLYPNRELWKRALARCRMQKIRTATLNIRYLLLAVISQVQESLAGAFAGRSSPNRLVSIHTYNNSAEGNRLERGRGGVRNRPGPWYRGPLARLFSVDETTA